MCVAALGALGATGVVEAQEDTVPTDTSDTSSTTTTSTTLDLPLIPVPSGCVAPTPPDIVFVGTLTARDFRTGRFRIESVRAGDAERFAADGLIDVRYGIDTKYLAVGDEYLVAAQVEPVLGVLVSKIREPAPAFGGDDIVGLAESDVDCPVLQDPVRTLTPDGSSVESGVFAPLFERKAEMVGAFLIPLGIAFAVIFALALVRHGLHGVARGITAAARPRR